MRCEKECPRCGARFVCTHDIDCECVGVRLTAEARSYIRAHYSDCLCCGCLKEINSSLDGH